jgi:signal transduction histidine kinase
MDTAGVAALALAAAALLALAALVRDRCAGPGVAALVAYLLLLGVGAVGAAGLVLTDRAGAAAIWITQWAELASLAWLAFALGYTGRGGRFRRRVLAGCAVVYAVLWAPLALGVTSVSVSPVVVELASIATSLFLVAVTLTGATLVVQAAARHGVLMTRAGVVLSAAAFVPWLSTAVEGTVGPGRLPPVALWYGATLLVVALGVAVAVFSLRALDATAATQYLGRRAVRAGTDDAVVVVDGDDRVVEMNAATRRQFGVAERDARGATLQTLVGEPPAALARHRDVELDTREGRRQFDVEVIDLGEQGGRPLGHVVTLRDVTSQRMREQGLDVLNRLLRHNLRNELSVVVGRLNLVGETVEDPEVGEHVRTARCAVESLTALSEKAASVQDVFEAGRMERSTVDVAAAVGGAVASVREDHPETAVDVSAEGDTAITSTERFVYLAVWNVVENAVEHGTPDDGRVDVSVTGAPEGVTVVVTDGGPGIPAAERAVIDREEETQIEHGTGVGLWLTNWATTACGGSLTFGDSDDGARVELWFPDRGDGGERGR